MANRIRPQTGFETTLSQALTAAGTTVYVTSAPTETSGYMVIEPGSSNKEIIKYTGVSGSTLTGVTRGLALTGSSDAAGTGLAHPAGVKISMTNVHYYLEQLVDKNEAETVGGIKTFSAKEIKIGDGTDTNETITAYNADASKPYIQYNATQNKWLISNDGSSTYDISAGGSGVSAGDDVEINSSVIDVRANIYEFTAGEALTAHRPVYYKSSDGKVYYTSGAAAGTTNTFVGFTMEAAAANATVRVRLAGIQSMSSYGTVLTSTIFSDTFTRADSNTVGGGWSEANETGADDASISSNQLKIGKVGLNSACRVYQSHGADPLTTIKTLTFSGTFNISSNPNSRTLYLVFYSDASFTDATRCSVSVLNGTTNNVIIRTNGTNRTTSSVTINTATLYYYWIDVIKNGSNIDINFYVSTTSTKPGAASSSASNVAYTTANTNDGFYVDSTNEGIWYFDSVSVYTTETPTALAADTLYYISDLSGRLGTSAGSTSKKVGKTLSASLILIKNDNE